MEAALTNTDPITQALRSLGARKHTAVSAFARDGFRSSPDSGNGKLKRFLAMILTGVVVALLTGPLLGALLIPSAGFTLAYAAHSAIGALVLMVVGGLAIGTLIP